MPKNSCIYMYKTLYSVLGGVIGNHILQKSFQRRTLLASIFLISSRSCLKKKKEITNPRDMDFQFFKILILYANIRYCYKMRNGKTV